MTFEHELDVIEADYPRSSVSEGTVRRNIVRRELMGWELVSLSVGPDFKSYLAWKRPTPVRQEQSAPRYRHPSSVEVTRDEEVYMYRSRFPRNLARTPALHWGPEEVVFLRAGTILAVAGTGSEIEVVHTNIHRQVNVFHHGSGGSVAWLNLPESSLRLH